MARIHAGSGKMVLVAAHVQSLWEAKNDIVYAPTRLGPTYPMEQNGGTAPTMTEGIFILPDFASHAVFALLVPSFF